MKETIKSKIKVMYSRKNKFGMEDLKVNLTSKSLPHYIVLLLYIASYYENLAKKLNNPLLQAKAYWSILKAFYNDKKISQIPPLLVDNKFLTDIKTKANIFGEYFAEQCTLLKNSSVLPINQTFLTQSRLISLDFNKEEILKIVRVLNVHKAHGHDDK